MKPITKVLSEWTEEYFGNKDIEISEDEDRATYRFLASEKGEFEYRSIVDVYESSSRLVVNQYPPFKISTKYRKDVAAVLVRSHCICMDMENGEIRYVADIRIPDSSISVAMINEYVDRGTLMLDQYLSAVGQIVLGEIEPAQAFATMMTPEVITEEVKTGIYLSKSEIRPWRRFIGSEPIKAWAEDLGKAISSNGDMGVWELAGRAAIIVNEDKNYCRELLKRVAADNNMQFISIAAADVMEMSPPSGLKGMAPAIVYLEPGRWMRGKADSDEAESKTESVRKFQSELGDQLGGFDPKFPVIYVASVAKLESVASRLMRVGRFERFLCLPNEDLEMLAKDFLADVGREICSETLNNSLKKIGSILKSEMDDADKRKLAALYLRRQYQREQRRLEFVDLVHAVTYKLQEEKQTKNESDELRKYVAIHEAGHAVVAVVDSGGKNIPEYASIIPSALFKGVVVESYSFHYIRDDINTYRDFRQNIRVCLAGRVAEEIVFGIDGITSSSSSDLESASRSASKAFAYWGFSPQMEISGRSSTNLGAVFGTVSDSEMKHVETLVREFLDKEYEAVKAMLLDHRSLLDAVADRLIAEPILDQSELSELCAAHVVVKPELVSVTARITS